MLFRSWKYYQEHPDGPYVYGPWDAFPPRANVKETHARWLKQYLPLVEEGTWAYLEISDSTLFAEPLPSDVVASAFINLENHLVVANYGTSDVTLKMSHPYVAPAEAGPAKATWTLKARSMKILRQSA